MDRGEWAGLKTRLEKRVHAKITVSGNKLILDSRPGKDLKVAVWLSKPIKNSTPAEVVERIRRSGQMMTFPGDE